jgi:transcriptional accessory protein Tex/SPT6
LQDNVTKEELLEALYQEMINVVNDVGVDVNKCGTNPYKGMVLQFVGGLGPR